MGSKFRAMYGFRSPWKPSIGAVLSVCAGVGNWKGVLGKGRGG